MSEGREKKIHQKQNSDHLYIISIYRNLDSQHFIDIVNTLILFYKNILGRFWQKKRISVGYLFFAKSS